MTRKPFTSVGAIVTALAIALLPLGACTSDSATGPSLDVTASAAVMSVGGVSTLAATTTTDSTVTLRWTQINDGTGKPASYRVKYALPAIVWGAATIGCNTVKGTQIGAPISCTVAGLARGTRYDFQLMSYRLQGSTWTNALYSNIAAGQTTAPAALAPKSVQDLAITGTTASSLTVRWTEVDGGGGTPASYRVKYALPAIQWSSATIGCASTISGTAIGAQISCTVSGLASGTPYEVQLMSFRLVNGAWQDATYSNVAAAATTAPAASAVQDLRVTDTTPSSLTVSWTQVQDGTGAPAAYSVKYASPPLQWSSATTGCSTLLGTQVGATMSCTVQGLPSGATYDFQVMSSRMVAGAPQGSAYSNIAAGTVEDQGIWVSASRLRQLPTSGPAWNNVLATANSACGTVDLTDQEQMTNVCIMAKALVFARIGGTQYRADVVSAVNQIASAPTYIGRALSLGRELGAYVIAADLIDLASYDPALDGRFRTALRTLRTTYTSGAAANLIDCHEKRPNNWGAHCGATRVAIALYLNDTADLARAAQVFKGYLGDRSSYAGFVYGTDLSWQCDPLRPVGINPPGCVRSGLSLDGVLPDDQRRGGSFTTSPPNENYVWEAMQGLLAQAVMLEGAGYAAFDWENRALLRAAQWQHYVNVFPTAGDDTWQAPLLNHVYGTSFPEQVPSRAGKMVGWTDWTHPS